jgi:DnaJ-class molecular chaperone
MTNFDEYYDRLHEAQFARNENIRIDDCDHCNGSGEIEFSDCCGAAVLDGICQDIECLKPCVTVTEKCDECHGEGTVETESNHEHDKYESRRDADYE